MNKFDLGNGFVANCVYSNGSSCFYHTCNLYKDGKRIARAQAQYYNRTWEAYNYQTVMKMAVRDSKHLSEEEKEALKQVLRIEPKKVVEMIY